MNISNYEEDLNKREKGSPYHIEDGYFDVKRFNTRESNIEIERVKAALAIRFSSAGAIVEYFEKEINPTDEQAVFNIKLEQGDSEIQAWLIDSLGYEYPAYYVYVNQ